MERLFFQHIKLSETLEINAEPARRPDKCPFCARWLAHSSDQNRINDHDMWFSFRWCPGCGWWDCVYREDGMMGNHEEESYYQTVLTDLSEGQVATLSEVALLNDLSQNADRLYELPPREVESIVASIFKNFLDCEVVLTKQTRDGGKDIIGLDSDGGSFIAEIKRYSATKKVDVSLVRQLLGVMAIDNVEQGVFITTSSYTNPAQEFANSVRNKTPWKMELKDMTDIRDWLRLGFSAYFDMDLLDRKVAGIAYANYGQFPRIFFGKNGERYDMEQKG